MKTESRFAIVNPYPEQSFLEWLFRRPAARRYYVLTDISNWAVWGNIKEARTFASHRIASEHARTARKLSGCVGNAIDDFTISPL